MASGDAIPTLSAAAANPFLHATRIGFVEVFKLCLLVPIAIVRCVLVLVFLLIQWLCALIVLCTGDVTQPLNCFAALFQRIIFNIFRGASSAFF